MSARSAIVILLGLGLASAGCDRQSAAPSQANATAAAAASDEVPATAAAAPVSQLDRTHKGEAAPAVAFEAPDGKAATLAGFRGKPLLLNLWATWCAPCIKELPTLDRLAAQRGKVRVIAVSQDMDAGKAAPFFAQRGVAALAPYRDPKLGLSLAYGANLPTTILYDAAGKEVWRYTGSLDWTGPEAAKLLGEAG